MLSNDGIEAGIAIAITFLDGGGKLRASLPAMETYDAVPAERETFDDVSSEESSSA